MLPTDSQPGVRRSAPLSQATGAAVALLTSVGVLTLTIGMLLVTAYWGEHWRMMAPLAVGTAVLWLWSLALAANTRQDPLARLALGLNLATLAIFVLAAVLA